MKETLSSLEMALTNQDRGTAIEILQSLAMIDPVSITYPGLCADLPQIKERSEQMLASLPAEAEPTIWTEREHLANDIYFSNLPGNQQDWITIVSKETPDTEYGQYFYTGGQVEGSLSFRGVVPGEYEVRLYLNWPDGGYEVESRFSFIVLE